MAATSETQKHHGKREREKKKKKPKQFLQPHCEFLEATVDYEVNNTKWVQCETRASASK